MGVDHPRSLDIFALGVRDGGVARTEIRGGHAPLGEERNIGPAKLGAHLKAVPFDQRLNERITESGARVLPSANVTCPPSAPVTAGVTATPA